MQTRHIAPPPSETLLDALRGLASEVSPSRSACTVDGVSGRRASASGASGDSWAEVRRGCCAKDMPMHSDIFESSQEASIR